MNYGRYFRLNQALSKVEDGVAIYDYVDLPAYFGPSVNNPMSPKYPISVTITSDTVCFRLHYSAFKLEKKENFDQILINNGKKRKIEKNFPQYAYDKDDIDIKSLSKVGNIGLNDVSMAHMEEVILELPFAQFSSSKLSDTIKDIYNTRFPQVVNENTSLGGRYLEQIIRKRYSLDDEQLGGHSMENDLYKRMREVTDYTVSYSTLWLMDLMTDGRIDLYPKGNDKSQDLPIVGFLRKLLLDFMFDLKHSDVFQNSANYQKMYSGLMSDFYFSALMHKCEYYYHRKLIRETINQDGGFNKKTVVALYAEELFRAEELWIKDVMSTEAEELFFYDARKNHKIWQEIKEKCIFEKYPSWFADPEEEMRRICFTMHETENKQERHMCNMDILVRLLNIRRDDDGKSQIESNMFKMRDTAFEHISQWFLKRYDFKDLFHLHLYKYANAYIVSTLIIMIMLIMPWIALGFQYVIIAGSAMLCLFSLLSWIFNGRSKTDTKNPIDKRRNKMVLNRVKGTCVLTAFITLFFALCFLIDIKDLYKLRKAIYECNYCLIIVVSALIIAPLVVVIPWSKVKVLFFPIEPKLQHLMSNIHLLLPRLVASITASWITISVGFDLYVAFFDATPDWSTVIVLMTILLLFVMYEINKVSPHTNAKVKLLRSFELIIFSYSISLIVGLFIVNFLGERFLEKGGYVGEGEFYKQYVMEGNKGRFHIVNKDSFQIGGEIDTVLFHNNVKTLKSVHHGEIIDIVKKKNTKETIIEYTYALIEDIPLFGIKHIFVLRDFLIMFSFIAMFMGIFIQLIIFGDNKQMTEL